jgi:26S proteasome regulatory subunit T4
MEVSDHSFSHNRDKSLSSP